MNCDKVVYESTAGETHRSMPSKEDESFAKTSFRYLQTIDTKLKNEPRKDKDNIKAKTKSSSGEHVVEDDKKKAKGRTWWLAEVRIRIALLGLSIAAVNCYAQATFCIAIVEMVLPADYVVKTDIDQSVVNVLNTMTGPYTDTTSIEDQSCPLEYKYKEYYDSWRFQENSTIPREYSSVANQVNNNALDISNRFDWDASRQGLLLGAFAIGTAPLQVVGGRLAEIYGAKWVLFAGCIGTAVTNLTIPLLAHYSFVLLILNRVLMGVTQAGMEPGLMCLLADWLTPAETGFFISMLLFAICLGFFLGSLCSSFILALGYGWPLAYYVAGGANLLIAVIWLVYADSRPSESRQISSEELKFIEREQQVTGGASSKVSSTKEENNDLKVDKYNPNDCNQTPPRLRDSEEFNVETDEQVPGAPKAPWLTILSTPSVWAFIICKISVRWCADVLSIELPTYLANVLHLSIKLNGILNSISSALFAIFSFLTGYLVNQILKSHQQRQQEDTENNDLHQRDTQMMSKTTLRKSFQSIASFGSAIAVFLMTQYDCNILFSMSMLLALSCCLVMGTGGELQIPYDMTSRYPGTLHGMACTLSVSGWLAPPLIGLILGDQPSSRYRWSLVWYLTAFINLVGGLVFVLFADASPRDFDSHRKSRRRQLAGYYNAACKSNDSSTPPLAAKKSWHYQRHEHHHHHHHNDNSNQGEPALLSQGVNSGEPAKRLPEPIEDNANSNWNNQKTINSDLNWSPLFDRELIRCRQVEESLIKPSYLHNLEVVAGRSTIFPYKVATDKRRPSETFGLVHPKQESHRRTCSRQVGTKRRAIGSLRSLLSRLVGSRAKKEFVSGGLQLTDDEPKLEGSATSQVECQRQQMTARESHWTPEPKETQFKRSSMDRNQRLHTKPVEHQMATLPPDLAPALGATKTITHL